MIGKFFLIWPLVKSLKIYYKTNTIIMKFLEA